MTFLKYLQLQPDSSLISLSHSSSLLDLRETVGWMQYCSREAYEWTRGGFMAVSSALRRLQVRQRANASPDLQSWECSL